MSSNRTTHGIASARANSWEIQAVLRFPIWNVPVGEGAKRTDIEIYYSESAIASQLSEGDGDGEGRGVEVRLYFEARLFMKTVRETAFVREPRKQVC